MSKELVIALGFFDGVHLGHAALLRRTVEVAKERGCQSAVFTFTLPPKEVVTGIPCPLINTPTDRKRLLQEVYGIDQVIMAPFDQTMMTTSWQDFVTELLIKQHHGVHFVAGHDHHFGHKNQGSPQLLAELCKTLHIGCDIVDKVELEGITVSSTYIRKLVEMGQMERACAFLGHPHVLTQQVQHGRKIGHTIGIPTVNLTIPPHLLEPAYGVYTTKVHLPDGRNFMGVTNVGKRPTVNNGTDTTVETWLLDFDEDLYGQVLQVAFYQRLRDEIRFDSLDTLRSQIQSDANRVRDYFA
ncbi:bifunctional riboflavin kinase/FAD synthetase [Bengtsoniella intestinalis]|uniref:bifunctional riboflavin kinase/FAD synthetase n=1 Tax=Bengtsoniella intestinalis TaxID=3073143 RepID=UPI00391F54F9